MHTIILEQPGRFVYRETDPPNDSGPDEALVCPGHGVYAAYADGAPAAVSVGVRPTFGTGRGVLIEAYLIDREVDLYGRRLRIQFLRRLRGERRFDSADSLIAQMEEDVERTVAAVAGTLDLLEGERRA